MFSDTYTNVAVDLENPMVARKFRGCSSGGNNTKKYSALNFVGVETIASQLMQHL
jgi:hypothetical protein